MAVISRARKQGLKLALHDILQSGSVRELAETAGSSVPIFRQEEKTGEHFRLSPIQDLYFRSADVQPSTGYFNQSIMVRVTRRVEPVVIENAVKAIVKQHSMFRARFSKASTGEWRQSITDVREISPTFVNCTTNFWCRKSTRPTGFASIQLIMRMKSLPRLLKVRDAWISVMGLFLLQICSKSAAPTRYYILWQITFVLTWYHGESSSRISKNTLTLDHLLQKSRCRSRTGVNCN